jgi:predicted CopG family antitoxin
MKVAKKSPRRSTMASPRRATLTLTAETYDKIDQLRGEQSRSAWIRRLVENEAQRRERDQFAQRLKEEYTTPVVRETLALNREFPIHEK